MSARGRTVSLVMAVVAGGLFGAGLLVSGMTQPAKVIGFLDITGAWDPSLAFVMGGAVFVYAIAYRVVPNRLADPWFAEAFRLPTRRDLDRPLVIGAAVFGIGWGLSGFCPGPGVVAAASGATGGLVFFAGLLAGMFYYQRMMRRGLART